MKHFCGTLIGNPKNDLSTTASKNESIQSHLRTFNKGILVSMYHHEGKDVFLIYQTNGTLGDREGQSMNLIKQLEF
jgi:hypothetical protein